MELDTSGIKTLGTTSAVGSLDTGHTPHEVKVFASHIPVFYNRCADSVERAAFVVEPDDRVPIHVVTAGDTSIVGVLVLATHTIGKPRCRE
jgi:hypothetical protein